MGNLDTNRIIATTHCCARCSKELTSGHLVLAVYWHQTLRSFEKQVEIGLLGANVRNAWVHFSCEKPQLKSWIMVPDLHSCVRCKKKFGTQDMVQPVFQITDPRAVNPADPTDVGISLNERVYFVHCDCTLPTLKNSQIIVPA